VSFYGVVQALFQPVGNTYFRLRVEGVERLPGEGPAIVAANHVSWLDPIVLGAACPRPVRFLIAHSVYERMWTKWFYAGMRAIPVDRSTRDPGWMRAALRALEAGELVGVFPEGAGLSSGPNRQPKPGAGLLAALSGAPFVPAALVGTREAWGPGSRFPKPGRVTVRFGEPYRAWAEPAHPGREEVDALVAGLMTRVRALENGSPV
jgi:1-acyl-sn-glycerol-3-phosphate acyltransferase